jgi:hypothetical protein
VQVEGTPLAMERDGCGLGHTAMERVYRCWIGHDARDGARRVLMEGTPLAMERDGCWFPAMRWNADGAPIAMERCRCCRKAGREARPEKGEAICIASLNGI